MAINVATEYGFESNPPPPTGDATYHWDEVRQFALDQWDVHRANFPAEWGDDMDTFLGWWQEKVFHGQDWVTQEFDHNYDYWLQNDELEAWQYMTEYKNFFSQTEPPEDFPVEGVEMPQLYTPVVGESFSFVDGLWELDHVTQSIYEFVNKAEDVKNINPPTQNPSGDENREFWGDFHDVYNTSGESGYSYGGWADEAMDPVQLIEELEEEDYEAIYGALLEGTGVPFEMFMRHFSEWIPSYDPQPDIMIERAKQHQREVQLDAAELAIDEQTRAGLQTGFQTSYSHVENLNNVLTSHQDAMSGIDLSAEIAVHQNQQEFYDDFISHLQNLQNVGAFSYEHYYPYILDEPAETWEEWVDDAQELAEDIVPGNHDFGTESWWTSFWNWWQWCDERMKENVKYLETTPSGINIYSFNYKDKLYGTGTWIGPMAQEVMYAANKEANGYLTVDLSKLPDDVPFGRIGD